MSVNTDLLRSLGVAKDQWYKRWIKGGTLRGNTPRYYRKLQLIHDFLASVRGLFTFAVSYRFQ